MVGTRAGLSGYGGTCRTLRQDASVFRQVSRVHRPSFAPKQFRKLPQSPLPSRGRGNAQADRAAQNESNEKIL